MQDTKISVFARDCKSQLNARHDALCHAIDNPWTVAYETKKGGHFGINERYSRTPDSMGCLIQVLSGRP